MSFQGKIIEYIEHGRFICGVVLQDSGKRLHLLNQNGREVSLPPARILDASTGQIGQCSSRDEWLKQLKSVDETRKEKMAAIDLEEIWTLASEEPETVFSPRFLAELAFGEEATDDHVAAFMRCIFVDRLFFKYKEGKINAHSPEVVEQLRIRAEKERQKEAFLVEGAKHLTAIWQGTNDDWQDKDTCLHLLSDYYLFGNEIPESDVARELLKRAGLTAPHDAYLLLVKAGVWERNENIPLLRHEVPVEFPDVVQEKAMSMETKVDELLAEGRKDFRKLPILTIDGEYTRDFDDALHIEKRGDNYMVGIHITDVAHYIKPGDPLFQEAVRRVTSIYFADGRVPMLPPEISEGVCSLIAGQDRPAMSFMVLLNEEGEVLDYDIYASIVKVDRQLSYSEVNDLIGRDRELTDLSRLADTLKQRRISGGAILLPIPDVNIIFDRDDTVAVRLDDVDSPARRLIAEFMVLANTLGARYVADQEVPGLYRIQGEPRKRLLYGQEKELFAIYRQRKFLSPAQLVTKAAQHSCVGVPQYTTVTSPIRRLLDLVMQLQIMSVLQGRGSMFSEAELKNMARDITTVQSKVNLVRQLRHRYWLLKFLAASVGKRVSALVIDKGPKRIQIVLTDCLLDGDLPANQAMHADPGDVISVKVARVSPLDNLLRLEW